jgi:hypothetical protein
MELRALKLREQARSERLLTINELLKEYGLRPLPSVGDNSLGRPEILDIAHWNPDTGAPFHDITFVVRRTTGQEYNHTVRFNQNGGNSDGVLFIPEINGFVALVRQYRIAIGAETWELARGFSEKSDQVGAVHSPTLPPALVRELGEEVIRDACVTSVRPLGRIAENTGTHNSWVDTYIVHISADQSTLTTILGGTQGLGVKFVPWHELYAPSALGIRDLHSLALIALAREATSS